MKRRIWLLPLPLSAIVLELMPFGAVLNFANPDESGTIATVRKTFSYFDPTPFGYANFAPLITAVLSCVLLILAAVFLFTGKCGKAITVTAAAACAVSLAPLLYGISFFSVVGGLISAALAGEAIISGMMCRKR